MSSLPIKYNGIKKHDLLKLALGSLGSNKLRTSLTILGVAIGVFSVVGVMTALSAVGSSIDKGLSFLGANVFMIQREPAIQFGGGNAKWRNRPRISPRQAQEFKEIMDDFGVPVSLTAYDGGERVKYKDKRTSPTITVVGTNEHYLTTNKYELEYGRNLTAADIEFNRPVIVIGQDVVKELFPNEDPLGKSIVASRDRYEVVGVLASRGEIFGNNMDNLVIIPTTRFTARNWHQWRSMRLSVQAPSAIQMAPTQDLAIGAMRLVRGLEPEDENDFELSSNDSLQEAFSQIAKVVGTGGLLISAIALLCSGIGIMNIMLVSVTERTREIGVRKSLGARRKDIMTQFLIESVFLSELGAAVGIIIGMIGGNIVATMMKVSMIVPWNWVVIAVVVCSVIGIGFGLYPAWRAARLNPVDALRYE
ncbi:MAG: ABC transporter permease [Opitutales bacterium]|nr:ABC transporter permease [Opitutales bacterium]